MELVRHRAFSFAQESTRYCNYSKDKFGNELTFIRPNWMETDYFDDMNLGEKVFAAELNNIEAAYFKLLEEGWQPQQARVILPNSLKTEVIMAGFLSDWVGGERNGEKWGFFPLRTDSAAHPQMRELAIPLQEEFKKRAYV